MGADRKFGPKNKAAAKKLTPQKVRDIRELYARSEATQGQLARDFGVSIVTIHRVIHRESWQDIPDRDSPPKQERTAEEIIADAMSLQRSLNPQSADEILAELDKGDTLE